MLTNLLKALRTSIVTAALMAVVMGLVIVSAAFALFQWLSTQWADYAASAATSIVFLGVAIAIAIYVRIAASRATATKRPAKAGLLPATARWIGGRLLDYGGIDGPKRSSPDVKASSPSSSER